jgi:hypothetical protein
MKFKTIISIICICLFVFISQLSTSQTEKGKTQERLPGNLDISTFGELRYWSDETGALGSNLVQRGLVEVPQTKRNEWNIGISWKEERDINRIEITYVGEITESILNKTQVQYWFQTWPGEAPIWHTIEDLLDDPWQGKWLTAETLPEKEGNTVVYRFKPLTNRENKLAGNLPGPVNYRRTLKVRMLYDRKPASIRSLKVYSPADVKKVSLRIEFICDKPDGRIISSKLEIFNGWIDKIKGWNWDSRDKMIPENSWKIVTGKKSKGIIADLRIAEPQLTGSNDLSIVTIRSDKETFSFLVNDLDHGPIYIPAYSAYISYASDTIVFANSGVKKGMKVREKLKSEPEQTYDRACREIPELSIMQREYGGMLYLPIAADASWQKFGFEWSGGFFMNKNEAKAKGRELARCIWPGDELHWYIGTGEEPLYLRDDKIAHMSILNDFLPVPQVSWNHEGLKYLEEGVVTLLEGPLSPYDRARDEQTPAILMVKLSVSNPSIKDKTAHIWLKAHSLENPLLQDLFIMDQTEGKSYIRAKITPPANVSLSELKFDQDAVHLVFKVPANQTLSLYVYAPFPGDLTEGHKGKISVLNYDTERQRVVSYWRDIVSDYMAFSVPERKFNEMARSVIPHIRMSTTKDPRSGLFMVPAASFGYQVFSNESAFQTIFLDKIGDHNTAASYLETFLKLQGTDPMPGTFTGDQHAVFHGGKVDKEYNYTMGPYNLDHGTVLWALAQHYLLSHDSIWLLHASPNMLKASDWIIEQRNQTKVNDNNGLPVIHYGLLPAGRLEDNADWGFWFAVNAYAWLGLHTTAEAFKMAGLPQAERLEEEADNYLHDLQISVKRSSELCPVVRLLDNTYVPFVPSRVYQRFRYFGPMRAGYYARYGRHTSLTYRLSATREALYGPMVLLTTGVIEPEDPLSEAILDDWEDNITLSGSLGQHIHGIVDDEYWFSRGGMVFQPNLQNPIQAYLFRNEIPAAIRNIYNAMVSCLYRDVNAFTEEYRRWGVGSGPMYKIPDESRFNTRICDMLVLEKGKELWLASGTPRCWLDPGNRIKVYNITTAYGSIAYEIRNGAVTNTIEASINLPSCSYPDKILLFIRAPFERPIKSVTLNGKEWKNWDPVKECIELPVQDKAFEVAVFY